MRRSNCRGVQVAHCRMRCFGAGRKARKPAHARHEFGELAVYAPIDLDRLTDRVDPRANPRDDSGEVAPRVRQFAPRKRRPVSARTTSETTPAIQAPDHDRLQNVDDRLTHGDILEELHLAIGTRPENGAAMPQRETSSAASCCSARAAHPDRSRQNPDPSFRLRRADQANAATPVCAWRDSPERPSEQDARDRPRNRSATISCPSLNASPPDRQSAELHLRISLERLVVLRAINWA